MPDVTQHDVFISYSRRDIAFARILHDALSAKNLGTWIDWQDIPPISDWLAEVYRAIDSANTFVFIISNTSVTSETCHMEIAHAIENNKRLVPIILHDVDPQKLPQPIASLNWIFFREQDDFQQSFEKLLQAIETDLDWVRIHTRLLQRAIEWENRDRDSSFLLRGSDLGNVLHWLAQLGAGKEPALTSLQIDYVQESQHWEAEQDRRWKQRTYIIWSVIGTAFVIAVSLAIWALYNADVARKQLSIARSHELAAYAQMTLEEDPTLSFQLALAALESKPTIAAKSTLWAPLQHAFTTVLLQGHSSHPMHVEFSPDGELIATSADDGSARIWNARTGEQLHVLEGHLRPYILSAKFSPDGKYVVTRAGIQGMYHTRKQEARIWDVATGELLHVLDQAVHSDCPAFSPDGKLIVKIPDPGEKLIMTEPEPVWGEHDVHILDIETGQLVKRLQGHTDVVTNAEFSPDGSLVVTASWDGTARIWDAHSGRELQLLLGHTSRIMGSSFSPDGNHIITSSQDETARVWDVVTGEELRVLKDEELSMYGVNASLSPDGNHIVTLHRVRGPVALWDAQTGELMYILPDSSDAAFSPDGKLLIITGTSENKAKVYDLATGEQVFILIGHSNDVTSVRFSPDGNQVITGSRDLTARVWQLEAGQETAVIDSVRGVSMSPDGRRIAISIDNDTCRIWDTVEHKELQVLDVRGFRVRFSADGNYIVSISDDAAHIWDVISGEETQTIHGHVRRINTAEFSPDGKLIVTACWDKTVIWDIATGKEILIWDTNKTDGDVSFSPDGKQIITVLPEGGISSVAKIWDAATGEELRVFKFEELMYNVNASFSPDGNYIVTLGMIPGAGSQGSIIAVWDAHTGQQLYVLTDKARRQLLHSPDGKKMLTVNVNNIICIWELSTGNKVAEFGVNIPLGAVEFSPDGQRVVAGYGDGSVRIWDIDSRRNLYTLNGHTDGVSWTAYSPDGTHIMTASGGDDGTFRIWPADSEEMMRLLNEGFRKKPRELTEAEKTVYGFMP